jgi:acyl carrier protein phosphodiesterase
MNHLAHLLLAEPTPESRLGNLAADYVFPRDVPRLPELVQRGIRQHRQVDAFTDRHHVIHRGMSRLDARWGWFKGILLDVYFDHLLALHWSDYCAIPLPQFAFEVNTDLLAVVQCLPEAAAGSVRRIATTNRLVTYIDRSGVEVAYHRITHILRERVAERAVDLTEALPDLTTIHADLETDFAEFFPQLQQFSGHWCRTC